MGADDNPKGKGGPKLVKFILSLPVANVQQSSCKKLSKDELCTEMAETYRCVSDGTSYIVATRGPGMYISELSHYHAELPSAYQFSAQAKGRVHVSIVSYPAIAKWLKDRHESEADGRAGMHYSSSISSMTAL